MLSASRTYGASHLYIWTGHAYPKRCSALGEVYAAGIEELPQISMVKPTALHMYDINSVLLDSTSTYISRLDYCCR